jgi:hypothetical protein
LGALVVTRGAGGRQYYHMKTDFPPVAARSILGHIDDAATRARGFRGSFAGSRFEDRFAGENGRHQAEEQE